MKLSQHKNSNFCVIGIKIWTQATFYLHSLLKCEIVGKNVTMLCFMHQSTLRPSYNIKRESAKFLGDLL